MAGKKIICAGKNRRKGSKIGRKSSKNRLNQGTYDKIEDKNPNNQGNCYRDNENILHKDQFNIKYPSKNLQ